MADQDLQIVARLQDLMSGPLRQIQTQVDGLAKAVLEQNRAAAQLQSNERAVAKALEDTTKALIGQAQAHRKSADESKKASDQTKRLALDQRELAGAAGDVAQNLGLNVAPLQAIAAAAGPLAATVAVVLGLSEALGAVIEKSKQINLALAGVAGRAGAGQLQQFRDDILQLSSATGIAAEQIAEGVASIFQNTTARTREAVGELLKQSVLLSKTGFGSVGEAAKALDGVLGALNLRVEESARAAAVLSTSADRAGVPIATFAQALEQSGPLARQFGLSLEDLSALLVSVKSQGIGLGDASNAIRALLTVFSDEGNATRKALEGIGINFKAASRDGQGFADILAQIAERTRGQPELLNALFPGGSQQLTRIFAAVEGASANFRIELERTGKAAEGFAKQVQDSTVNAGNFFSRFYNQALNESSSFWGEFTDNIAVGLAGITGNLDLAEAELKRAAGRLGQDIDFRSSPVIRDLAKNFDEALTSALESSDIAAAVQIRINLQETQRFIDEQVSQLGNALAQSASRAGLGQAAVSAEQLKQSLLFQSLQLTDADARLISDRLSRQYREIIAQIPEALKADRSTEGNKRIAAIVQAGLTAGLQDSIKGLNQLPQEVARLVAESEDDLARLRESLSFNVDLDARAAEEDLSAFAQSVTQQTEVVVSALSGIESEFAQQVERIYRGSLSSRERQVLELEDSIRNIKALQLELQFIGDASAADKLATALSNLNAQLRETQGISAPAGAQQNLAFFESLVPLLTQAGVETAKLAQEQQNLADAQKMYEGTLPAQEQQALATERQVAELRRLIAVYGEGSAAANLLQVAIGNLTAAKQSDALATDALIQANERQITFGEAFRESLQEIGAAFADVQQQARFFAQDLTQGVTNAFEGLFNNIAQGKASLRDFGSTILQVVQQAIARLFALKAASAFLGIFGGGALGANAGGGGIGPGVDGGPLGLAQGGVVQGHMIQAKALGGEQASRWREIGAALKAGNPVRSYARGGVTDRPQVAVFGEGGAEAFVPLPGPNRGIPVEFKREPRSSRGDRQEAAQQTVNLTLNVGSLDPRTAAEVILAQMPQIQTAIASALSAGRDRQLLSAVRGAVR